MMALLAALQATAVEPLPEGAASSTVQAAAALPDAGHNGLNILQLVLHASIPVQLVLLLLLFASIASWVIIFRKKRVLDRAEREAVRFEERFWSGSELSKLYAGATERNRDIAGLEAIFEGGFREFNRIRSVMLEGIALFSQKARPMPDFKPDQDHAPYPRHLIARCPGHGRPEPDDHPAATRGDRSRVVADGRVVESPSARKLRRGGDRACRT